MVSLRAEPTDGVSLVTKPKFCTHVPCTLMYYMYKKVKVKCTLVQALRLCTGRTAHRMSRGIALLFHDQRL